jgi:hypothetical protein
VSPSPGTWRSPVSGWQGGRGVDRERRPALEATVAIPKGNTELERVVDIVGDPMV